MRPRATPYVFASEQAVPGIWWQIEGRVPEERHAAIPAGRWDERALNHIEERLASELDACGAYAAIADHGDPSVRYLGGLIASDERRHRRILSNLAATLRAGIAGEAEESDVLDPIHLNADQRAELLRDTQRLVEVENENVAALQQLQGELSASHETLWPLLAEYMALDADKHLQILTAVERYLKHDRE